MGEYEMKKKFMLLIVVFVAPAICVNLFSDDKIDDSLYYRWEITRNGLQEVLMYKVGSDLSEHSIFGYINDDNIKGYQVGRHVVFYRRSDTNQIWTGWISEDFNDVDSLQIVSGSYSCEGENVYPWYGQRTIFDPNEWPVIPRPRR